MSKPLQLGSAVSAIALAAMLSGCAASHEKTGFGGRTGDNVGLATRALMALHSNDTATAIDFAERAVANTPDDAGFRAILGNAYFKAGRFASAEAAYKDSLTIYANQPQVILRLALVETALGKRDEAVSYLQAGRSVLDASNYGLALALAGRPSEAITILESAARQPGADATVRQNLALAHGLAGDWTEARTIAAQDVPGNKLDARIHEWMLIASPAKASDQVAAIVGINPAADDRGQPTRLALRRTDTRVAKAAAPAPAPVAQPAPQPPVQVAEAVAPLALPTEPKLVQASAAPTPAPEPAPVIAPPVALSPAPAPVVAEAPAPTPVAMIKAAARDVTSAAAEEISSVVQAFTPKKPAAVAHRAKPHRVVAARRPSGPGTTVMQLGSYRSPEQVTAGWNNLTKRYPALRAYLPSKARFDSPKGTFWRLSIQGFDNQRDAIARCEMLKSHGGKCFVRAFAGDAPVEIASR